METVEFCILGRAGAGKTMFIRRLLPHLCKTGVKVATLKLSGSPMALNYPATDAASLANAGAERSVVVSSDGMMIFPALQVPSIDQAVEIAARGCDILLIEGRRLEGVPVIEVVRAGLPVLDDSEVWLSYSLKPTHRDHEVADEESAAEEILKRVALERSQTLAT